MITYKAAYTYCSSSSFRLIRI